MTSKTLALTQSGLNLIAQALSIFDQDLRLVVCNRRYRDLFDLPKELTTAGARFEDTIRYLVQRGEYDEVEDPEAFVQDRVDQARAFEPHYLERQRANGDTISIEGSPLPSGGWVAVYTDITALKVQERLLRSRSDDLAEQVFEYAEELSASNRALAATNATLQETQHELTEMAARARMTAEMMPAHIARIDRARRYTYSNRQLSTVMPSRPSEITGKLISETLDGGAYDQIKPSLDRAFQGTSNVFEFTDDVSSRRIRVAFTPDRSEAGAVSGVYILSMDITEEAQARAALAQTHKRELAAQLTNGLAHDFSNLLTIILGAQSRLGRQSLDKAAQELVHATTAAARRGGRLLNRLAKISGPREMRPVATDLPGLLREIVILAKPSLPEGIALELNISRMPALLDLDPASLQDSLLNLIINARDAIGDQGRIRISASVRRDTWVEIQVCDSGGGFSEEALRHALDPFFTTKGGEGSGLGLSMVYDLVQLAGGHVRLENTGPGACVTLRLPLRLPPLHAKADTTSLLVLLIEDNADIRTLVREMLVDMGHQVIEAGSAEEGLALAHIDGLGLVLSDISLEHRSAGLDLARKIRDTAPCPVRLMTSRSVNDPIRIEAARDGPVIGKPFTATQLNVFLREEPGND
jgi:signal transduction histidine kinase/CheY-like chemotaxis protein